MPEAIRSPREDDGLPVTPTEIRRDSFPSHGPLPKSCETTPAQFD
jgi:hypothetical protein